MKYGYFEWLFNFSFNDLKTADLPDLKNNEEIITQTTILPIPEKIHTLRQNKNRGVCV